MSSDKWIIALGFFVTIVFGWPSPVRNENNFLQEDILIYNVLDNYTTKLLYNKYKLNTIQVIV